MLPALGDISVRTILTHGEFGFAKGEPQGIDVDRRLRLGDKNVRILPPWRSRRMGRSPDAIKTDNEEVPAVDLRLSGKAFVVVGGTAGMGLAGATALAEDGAAVVVVGRNESRAKDAAAALAASGAAAAHGLVYDVSEPGAAVESVARS